MKKIIIILTLTLLSNSCLRPMQSCSSAQLEQTNHELAVRITGTNDGIDVVIPGEDAVIARTLQLFLRVDTNPNPGSRPNEKDFSLHLEPFNAFESSDFERMSEHLHAIANGINEQDIFQACDQEPLETNIKQLQLAHFFDIEKLLKAESLVIQKKCCDSSSLVDFKDNPRLSELMQFIPGNIQWNIVKALRNKLGTPIASDRHPLKDQIFLPGIETRERCETSSDGNRKAKIFDHSAQIFDARSGQLLCTMSHPKRIINAKFSPNGNHIALVGELEFCHSGEADWGRLPSTFIVMIFDINSGRLLHRLENVDSDDIMFSQDGNRMAIVDLGSWVRIWDTNSGQLLSTIRNGSVPHIEFSPSGNRILIIGCCLGSAEIWDICSGQLLLDLGRSENAFFLDENQIITISNNTIDIWDINSNQLLHKLEFHPLFSCSPCRRTFFKTLVRSMAMTPINAITNHCNFVLAAIDGIAIDCHILEKTLLMWLIEKERLDFNVPENNHLKNIFDALSEEQQDHLKDLVKIRSKRSTDDFE